MLEFQSEILDRKTPEQIAELTANEGEKVKNLESVFIFKDICVISGLYLEGAKWDKLNHVLSRIKI